MVVSREEYSRKLLSVLESRRVQGAASGHGVVGSGGSYQNISPALPNICS